MFVRVQKNACLRILNLFICKKCLDFRVIKYLNRTDSSSAVRTENKIILYVFFV
jgi:hypothetical protein